VEQFGPPGDVVVLLETKPRPLTPYEVRVRMIGSAINPSDIVTISGAYRSRIGLPFFPGYEGVGVVEETGGQVTELQIGDRVLPIGSAGCWQELKVSDAKWCFPVSDALSFPQAATMYVNPATAWLMLDELVNIVPRLNVVISAAASAIGCMMIRLLNLQGIEPIVTVRTERSAQRLENLRVRQILLTTTPSFETDLTECSRRVPVDIVLDAVGGDVGRSLAGCLRPNGLFIQYGLLSGEPIAPEAFHASPIRYKMFSLREWIHRRPRAQIAALLTMIERLVLDHTLDTPIEASYSLEKIHAALQHQGSPYRAGKILLSIS
jgi:NADPH2:quinone reductase